MRKRDPLLFSQCTGGHDNGYCWARRSTDGVAQGHAPAVLSAWFAPWLSRGSLPILNFPGRLGGVQMTPEDPFDPFTACRFAAVKFCPSETPFVELGIVPKAATAGIGVTGSCADDPTNAGLRVNQFHASGCRSNALAVPFEGVASAYRPGAQSPRLGSLRPMGCFGRYWLDWTLPFNRPRRFSMSRGKQAPAPTPHPPPKA